MTPSPQSPLSLEEKQRILGQLLDYVALLKKNAAAQADLTAVKADLRKFLEEERANQLGLAGVSQKDLDLCTSRNSLLQQQLEFYQNAYEVCKNAGKRSKGCWAKKIVSVGLWRCK